MSLRPVPLPTRSSNIFINYRRDDSAGHAGRLFDRLSSRFPGRVFMDIDTIEPGSDFVETIEHAVGCCEVLVVVIGREWLNLTDATGHRRVDNPNDFVRLEIAAALARKIRIIPVLVEEATMPRPQDVPPELAPLTRRNAIQLSDVRWAFDVDRLIQAIEGVLQDKAPSALLPVVTAPSKPAPVQERARPRAWAVLSLLVLLALTGWLGWDLARQLSPQEVVVPVKLPQASPVAAERERQPAAPPQEETTRTPKVVPQEPADDGPDTESSPAGKRRMKSLVQKGKNVFKNLREHARRGDREEDDDRRGSSERQDG